MTTKPYIFVFLLLLFFAQANGQYQQGLVLSPVELFADSMYSAPTKGTLSSGQVVEIVGQSKVLHEDMTQTQQFYWYLVKNNEKTGWIMGAELAILHLNPSKFVGMNRLTGAPYNIGKAFEKSVFYWGEVTGKDNESSHFSKNNEYHENYLVFVNPKNEVVYLPAGTQSERGDNICMGIYFADLTGDSNQEIILYRSLSGKEMDEEVRTLEIYQNVERQFKLIFEERLNLEFASRIPSPARFKFVDIHPEGIRIAYPKYDPCKAQHFGESIKDQPVTYQKCLTWSSETFTWDKINHQFNHFYQPSSLPLRASIATDVTYLREKPTLKSASIQILQKKDRLKVLAHLETIQKIKNKKVVRIFLLVKSNSGEMGYLPSDQVTFTRTQHANLLNAFYSNPPLLKSSWQGEMDFIKLRGFQEEAYWELTGNFIPKK